jgi:regulatory factor X
VDEWLKQNYEVAEGTVLPRSTLQNHYLKYCKENRLYHITASLLGKYIRDVFPGVVAKRLGKRGNSKYHYCGIRAIGTSGIYELSGDQSSVVHKQQSSQILFKLSPDSDGSESDILKQNTNHSARCGNSNSSQQKLYNQQYLGANFQL